MSNTTAAIPAFPFELLPAPSAYHLQIKTYLFAGVSGVFVWDVLTNLISDWYLLCLAKSKYTPAAYVMSRVASLAYIIGRTIFMTYPMGNCRNAFFIINCFFPLGLAGSNFLFFLRARAVYMGHKYMTALFAFLWLASFGAAFTIPFASLPGTMNIGNTSYCGSLRTEDSAIAAVAVPAINDTIIFLAISYKLMSHAYGLNENQNLGNRILGRNLPEVSKALLRDGQKYYLVTIVSNLATIAVGLSKVPLLYQWMLTGPNLMLTNIMACYVYRHTILSALRDPTTCGNAQVIPSITMERTRPQSVSLSALRFGLPLISPVSSTRSVPEGPIVVEITSESITHADLETGSEKVKPNDSFV